MLAAILESAGYRTGLYSSPHLVRVNERIRVSGQEISESEFAAVFTAVHHAVVRLIGSGTLPQYPSFFEYLTAVAFQHFAQAGVDFAVLEVGMGGRLDATNVTNASVAVITNVDLDHQEFLGNTLAAIAAEKAGVIKPGRPVVSGCEHPEARDVIRQRCRDVGVELLETRGLECALNLFDLEGCYGFDLRIAGLNVPGIELQMPGMFQVKNAATAAAAAWQLARAGFRITPEAIRDGLHAAVWPGRLEVVRRHPLILLDGAHNPAAAREVAGFIRRHFKGRTLRLVYASMRDKAIGEISSILFPLAKTVYLTRPGLDRAAAPEQIREAAAAVPQQIFVEPDPVRALAQAVSSSLPEDVVLVAGSLFLVGAVKCAILEGRLATDAPAAPEVFSELS